MGSIKFQTTGQVLSIKCLVAFVLLFLGIVLQTNPGKGSPLEALRTGSMRSVIQEVISVYEEHDISWPSHIHWDIQGYDTVFWYYSAMEDKILVGDLPSQSEVADYWKSWSQALTEGNWNPDNFFVSQLDAYDMALFNQYVLATHESAHAVTYRYDPDHHKRHGYEINCREFYADRLTAAIIQTMAKKQPELESMRKRYLELVRSMHKTIPGQYLVTSADYSDLVEDCAIIEIDQPTPDSLQSYASAYFARWEALLVTDLPALDTIFETHLKQRLQQRYDWVEQAEEWSNAHISTLRQTDKILKRILNSGSVLEGGKRAAAFAPDGTLWVAEASFDRQSSELEFVFGLADGFFTPKRYSTNWPRMRSHVRLRSIAVMGSESFVATFEEDSYHTSLVHFKMRDGAWMPHTLATWKNASIAYAFRTADDRLFVGLTHFFDERTEKKDKSYWTFNELDLENGAVLGTHHIQVESKEAVAVDPAGRFYLGTQRHIFRVDSEQNVHIIAGSGLEGARDGPVDHAELGGVQLLQFYPDGSALLLDDVPGDYNKQMIRKLEVLSSQ